jgi:hypothetical protein
MQEMKKANQGKVFKLKDYDYILGEEFSVGYIYFVNGEKLEKPLLIDENAVVEIDKPIEEIEEE